MSTVPQPVTAGPVTPAALRTAMGALPTGVTVVAARAPSGRPVGSTVSAVMSLSLSPPLIAVALRLESETLAAIETAGAFGVSVLAGGQEHMAGRFARRGPDDWDGVRWAPGAAGAPLLVDTLSALSCVVDELLPGGDHRLVIGRVVEAEAAGETAPPLAHHRGAYGLVVPTPPAPAAPASPDPVDLPSRLGDLAVHPLGTGRRGETSVAVLVGDPRGTRGTAVYLHEGCLLGDALGSTACASRRELEAALDLLRDEGRGVVVYHRDETRPFGGCCVPGAHPRHSGAGAALQRAIDELQLGSVRLLIPHARVLTAAVPGIDDYVAMTVP